MSPKGESQVRELGALTRVVFEAALDQCWRPEVFERAMDYGVDALLYRYAQAQALPVPSGYEGQRHASLARQLWRRRVMSSLLSRFEEAGVGPVLVLKGEPLGVVLYGDGASRCSGDVDLLMGLEGVEAAAQVLKGLGYRAMYRDRPEPWLYDQWAFVHEETALVVELHWAICPPPLVAPRSARLFEQAQEVELGAGVRVRALDDAAVGLHLGLHFAHHGGHFKGLLDVAGWLDRFEEQPQVVAQALMLAREVGLSGALLWPAVALSRLGGQGEGLEILLRQRSGSAISGLGWWTARCVRGALSQRNEVKGASALAFKTQQTLQAQVMLWQSALGAIVDEGALGVSLFPWFRSPQVYAAERGAASVGVVDWVACGLRPWHLVREQRALWRVRGAKTL